MNIPGHESDFVQIKPKKVQNPENKDATLTYFYVLYDLCLVTPDSNMQVKIENNGPIFKGAMVARIDPVQTFKVNCVELSSDWFTPRQEHAACNTYDQKLFVFGGKNFIGDKANFLNDVLYYDELKNVWKEIKVKGPQPAGRFGHTMFCYYNYLIVFGGQGEGQTVFGDLWVFDILKEDWHMIMDSNDVHALTHQNVDGIIPSGRVHHSGEINERFGAAFITGGKVQNGQPACDMWALNIDKLIEYVERPDESLFENIWSRKDDPQLQELFCRWGHATGFIDNRYMFVYGGINHDNKVVRDSFAFDMLEYYIVPLAEKGDHPSV